MPSCGPFGERTGSGRGARDYSSISHGTNTLAPHRKGEFSLIIALDILKWPGINQAFLVSLIATLAMTFGAIFYGKRRPIGTPYSWGESMLASVYVFAVMFIAYGVVPDRFIQHADKELEWNKQKLLFGPFDIFKDQPQGGWFPFTISYQEVRDIVVVLIHAVFFALQVWAWIVWQNRGKKKASSTEVETSTYGRPLVKKA